VLLLAARLLQAGVLWTEEDLPLAAARQMLHGATLYKDIWFDKPPLVPAIYLLWGVRIGWVLRVAGALYAFAACLLAWALAAEWWSKREGYCAAALIGFFLTFDTHSAVLPLAADLLLLVPHLAAVLLVSKRQYFWSGVAAGVGFLFNAKGLLVLAICAVFGWGGLVPLLAGFIVPNVAALLWLTGSGALASYIEQVWRWPAQYAGSPVVANPVWNGALRTANWLGFHGILLVGFVAWWILDGSPERRLRPKLANILWVVIALIGVTLGWRFFPRYYFLLLPAITIPAARGLSLMPRRYAMLAALLLLVPLVRFGPRYLRLSNWSDLALDEDSRAASKVALQYAPPGGSLYVWGYRPEDYVYTGLRPATKYLECQAMTGVPADRHLTQSSVVLTAGTHEARVELAASRPDVLIDGLSLYNPALSMAHYPELREWMNRYKEIARTHGSVIYVLSRAE
jgi:hypothetical protein